MHGYTEGPLEAPTVRYISLGAGVQSSVMALLAARGEIGPMPDFAVFADTQQEPASIYEHLEWLREQLPFPTHVVTAGDLGAQMTDASGAVDGRFVSVPLYTAGGGLGRRQCTREFKIAPINKFVRGRMGIAKGERAGDRIAEGWHGITVDEIQRMKASRERWAVTRYPLVEKRWSRADCQAWFEREYPGRRLEKSACVFCPFKPDAEWRRMRDTDPESWQRAVDFDHAVRANGPRKGMNELEYVHRGMKPLDEVELKGDVPDQISFLDECDGMCGV